MQLFRQWPAILGTAIILGLSSCDRDNNHPGYDFFPDMAYSHAYETNSANSNFKDGKTMRAPVQGTVSRDFIDYPLKKNDQDRALAGKTIVNPLPYTRENIERGKKVYQAYCLICHGETGDGKGFLFTSGKYPFPPASLINDKMRNAPDGEFYHVITVGFGIMSDYGSQIRPDDRWKTIMYIRQELEKK
ncbi:MAG: cytochrome c [Bacteroidales bacterium]|nr:cytochrome c [Bacteroidales bacterium]